jgi:hypothetical protein
VVEAIVAGLVALLGVLVKALVQRGEDRAVQVERERNLDLQSGLAQARLERKLDRLHRPDDARVKELINAQTTKGRAIRMALSGWSAGSRG